MSTLLVGQVWGLDLPHNLAWVLMAMVDHGDHEGKHIYPGLDLLAWKTGYSPRQVSTIIQELLDRKILEVDQVGGGRGKHTEYSAHLDRVPRRVSPAECRKLAALAKIEAASEDERADDALEGANPAETARFSGVNPAETARITKAADENLAVSPPKPCSLGVETLQSSRGKWVQSLTVNHGDGSIMDRSVKEVWELAQSQLRLQMTKGTYETWVHNTRALGFADGAFQVGVPNQYAQEWLSKRLHPTIKRTLTSIAGRVVEPVFTVQP
jgi:hypothetical protein